MICGYCDPNEDMEILLESVVKRRCRLARASFADCGNEEKKELWPRGGEV